MAHPTNLPQFETLDEVAKYIENMRYDKVVELFEALAKYLSERSQSDVEAGRVRLASHLGKAAVQMQWASEYMRDAWDVCKDK